MNCFIHVVLDTKAELKSASAATMAPIHVQQSNTEWMGPHGSVDAATPSVARSRVQVYILGQCHLDSHGLLTGRVPAGSFRARRWVHSR